MDVLLMLNKLVAHLLIQISALVAKLRQILQSSLYQMETIHVVLYAYIERSGDGAFLLVAANMNQTVVVTAISQLMDESCIIHGS